MQQVKLSLVIFILSLQTVLAQETPRTIFYAKDSSSIIQLNSYLTTVFVCTPPANYSPKQELPLTLSIHQKSITLSSKVEAVKEGQNILFGELPPILFDTKLKGHLAFGKAMLSALDSAGKDSIIMIKTQALNYPSITGPLYLDLKGNSDLYWDYWREVEYYWLLDKQITVQDSITKLNADHARANALKEASVKYLTATTKQVELGQKELDKKYSQYQTTFDRLIKINTRLDETFAKSTAGQTLTLEEKKHIAYLTADGSKIKKELKKQPDGKSALTVFERMSKAMTQHASAQHQYENAQALLQKRADRLDLFLEESNRIQNRLKILKKHLKL